MTPVSLVTGGAGFIGSHLVRHLRASGHRVVVLDDLSGGFAENVPDGAALVQASITDQAAVAELFDRHAFDYVYHLAAYAAEGLSHFIRGFNYANNIVGSAHVINQCVNHDVKCLVFTSSIAVYGAGQLPLREDLVPMPEDPYGIAKYAVEQDLRAAREMFGLNYVVFRPHNVYGEYQNIGDPYRNVVGIFMNRLMQGLPMPVFGDGRQTRAFSYVGDLVPTIARSVHVSEAYGEVYNIGADADYSVSEVAAAVAAALGVEGRVEHLAPRREVVHAYSDHAKLVRAFGEPPQTPLAEGLRRMAAWALTTGARTGRAFERIEIERDLPPSWRAVAGAAGRAG